MATVKEAKQYLSKKIFHPIYVKYYAPLRARAKSSFLVERAFLSRDAHGILIWGVLWNLGTYAIFSMPLSILHTLGLGSAHYLLFTEILPQSVALLRAPKEALVQLVPQKRDEED